MATAPSSTEPDAQQNAAIRRVRRLTNFQREHPECSLVDNPDAVQTIMSRADIANTLRTCLEDVTTTSGIPVSSPEYAVIGPPNASAATATTIEDLVSQLSFPMIVKPLVAAGTKASHAMTVLMDRSALGIVAEKAPCLCQEYSNHDAVLYKVYVLGEYVSVHKRRSLPNLPVAAAAQQQSSRSFVEFDSQRPYPRLQEFGFVDEKEEDTVVDDNDDYDDDETRIRKRAREPDDDIIKPIHVSTEEVKPIVDALKEAFGLELFGFDILVVNHEQQDTGRRRMLVVDVNYFPSYKEVANFPALLAKYLTDRAIENRRRAAFMMSSNSTA